MFATQPIHHPIAPWLQEEDSRIDSFFARNARLPDFAQYVSSASNTPRGGSPIASLAVTDHSHTEMHSQFSFDLSSISGGSVSDAPTISEDLMSGIDAADLPGFSRSGSSAPSSSVDTGLGRDTMRQTRLDITPGGVSVAPTAPESYWYECTFTWLDCGFVSNDFEQWKRHCLSHFYPEEPGPCIFQCPLCPHRGGPFTNGWDAWELRLNHMAAVHYRQGHDVSTSRPDFELIDYMWAKRLIDNRLYMQLKSSARLGNQVTESNERRRRPQPSPTPHMAVRRGQRRR